MDNKLIEAKQTTKKELIKFSYRRLLFVLVLLVIGGVFTGCHFESNESKSDRLKQVNQEKKSESKDSVSTVNKICCSNYIKADKEEVQKSTFEEIDYYWLYSSLLQCIAALIGIIGLLAVYRLQIQETIISDARSILIRYLSILRKREVNEPPNEEWYSYMDDAELEAQTEVAIKEHSKDVADGKDLKISTMRVETFEKKLNNLKNAKINRELLKPWARRLVVFFISFFIFVYSLLVFASVLKKSYVLGVGSLILVTIILIIGAVLLTKFCFKCFKVTKTEKYIGIPP